MPSLGYLLLGSTEVRDGDAAVGESLAGILLLAEDLLRGQAALEHLHLLLCLQVHLQPLLALLQVPLQGSLQFLQDRETLTVTPTTPNFCRALIIVFHAGEHLKPHTRFWSPVLPRSLCTLMGAPGASIPTMPGSSSMQPCCCWQPNSSTDCLPWKSSWEHPLPFPQMPFTLALKACYKFFQGRSLLCSLAPKGKQNQKCQRVRNYHSL